MRGFFLYIPCWFGLWEGFSGSRGKPRPGKCLTLEDEDPILVQLPGMSLEAAESAAFKASPEERRHKSISQQNEERKKLNK